MNANQQIWQELRSGLGILPPPTEPSSQSAEVSSDDNVINPEQEAALKAEIVSLWKQHTSSQVALAPLLYKLCKSLHAPGKKGMGFDAWIEQAEIPHSTAYRWIAKYCKREGLSLPYAPKQKPEPLPPEPEKPDNTTLSHVEQTLPLSDPKGPDLEAGYIPQPRSLSDVKAVVIGVFESTDLTSRCHLAQELIDWITEHFVNDPGLKEKMSNDQGEDQPVTQ
jgi:hypothetical protein